MIARAKREKEEKEGLEDGFGIYDLEEAKKELATPDVEAIKNILFQNQNFLNKLKNINNVTELEDLANEILKRMIETKFDIQQDSIRCGYAPTCGL